jgi:hypothetical protein
MSAHDESSHSSTESNTESNAAGRAADAVRKAFAALPFDQKIFTLLNVELDMVGEVVETIVNVASRAVDEIADALSANGPAHGAADSEVTSL